VVRARNIFRKAFEQQSDFRVDSLDHPAETTDGEFLKSPDGDDVWGLVRLAGLLDVQVAAALAAREPAFVAKYAFELAQAFNLFYHRHRILSESNPERKMFLLRVSRLVERQLVAALDLLGIEAPEKM
jgi:arginyl-tRNA synthetase